jgi:hypothetical protein
MRQQEGTKHNILFIIWIEEGPQSKGEDTIRLQMSTKDWGSDAETLYHNPFVSHHQISLLFKDMFQVLISCDITCTNKVVYEVEGMELFIDQRVHPKHSTHGEVNQGFALL